MQVGWSLKMIMIPSTRARSCKNVWHHNHFNFVNGLQNIWIWIPSNTSRHFSNDAWTNSWHLQEVFENCRSVCVQCIPISINKFAYRFMLCWRTWRIEPITKDFVSNLNKTEYMYSFSLGFVVYFLDTNLKWHLAYMCTSLCSMISNFQIWKGVCEVFVVVWWRWVCSKSTQYCLSVYVDMWLIFLIFF